MKMGTIASLRRYDVAAAEAIRPDNLRRTAILRYASWGGRLSNVAGGPVALRWQQAAISINPGYGPWAIPGIAIA
jgi:hypothetical protein